MEADRRPRRGIVFILSAPSGAGKTTLSRAALDTIGGLEMSVSLTTRRPRASEMPGLDYHFVSEAEFARRTAANELAELATVFDSRYGTPAAPLERAIATGRDILLDIDVQGARQIHSRYRSDAVSIFVLPPSFAELEGRLRGRATDTEVAITGRLKRAHDEASAYPDYDYLIVNAEVADSLARLEAIVVAERLRVTRLAEGFDPWKG